jgi:hypothetical protein
MKETCKNCKEGIKQIGPYWYTFTIPTLQPWCSNGDIHKPMNNLEWLMYAKERLQLKT